MIRYLKKYKAYRLTTMTKYLSVFTLEQRKEKFENFP